MDRLKNNYIWLVFLFSIVGIGCAYLSSEAGLISESVKVMDDHGNIQDIVTVKPAMSSWIWTVVSMFSFSLAISLFISVFVINRLDQAFAREREEELKGIQDAININVFDSLFKTLVPREIFDVFKSDVISNRIVRKNANWLYDFREIGQDGEIELTQTIKYELLNISHECVDDAISAKFDNHATGSGIRRAVCMFEGNEIASFDVEDIKREAPLEVETTKSEDGKVTLTRSPDGYSKLLINVTIPPGKKVDVTVVYISIYSNNYVNDGYFTKYPMINASLTATYPESYDFDIFQALSSELRRTLKEKNRSIYEVKGGILPHQGFVYTLKKRNTDSSE